MTATLESLIGRTAAYLQDPSSLVFSSDALQEALRLALAEYNLALGSTCTLDGLDNAEQTTLPAEHESVLVLGAAGLAASARSMRRAEFPSLAARQEQTLAEWGEQNLQRFYTLLELALLGNRLAGLAAAEAPYPVQALLEGWRLDASDRTE